MSLALGLAFTAAATVFVVVAEEVVTAGDMASFDVLFARALRTTVTPSWERFFSGVSRTGSPDVLVVATLVVAVALLVKHQSAMAAGWLFAQAGSGLLILVLKTTFARASPESAGASSRGDLELPQRTRDGNLRFPRSGMLRAASSGPFLDTRDCGGDPFGGLVPPHQL